MQCTRDELTLVLVNIILICVNESKDNGDMLKNGTECTVNVAYWDFTMLSSEWSRTGQEFLAATNVSHLCKEACMECSLEVSPELCDTCWGGKAI
jgi:hypothetical protein